MRTLPLLLVLALASAAQATRYTKYAKTHATNANNVFFDPATYGGRVHPTPYTPIASNREFRAVVNAARACSGQYCVSGAYACSTRGTTSCYHVEHMLDMNGQDPRVPQACRRCKDVPGNLIMAAGPWNTALGGLAGSNYAAAQSEKTEIYGAALMASALAAVRVCCGLEQAAVQSATPWPQDDPPSNSTDYDTACDDATTCNCDADNDCGCDCDYDDASLALLFSAAALTIADLNTTISLANLGLLVAVATIALMSACCVCFVCYRHWRQPPPPLVPYSEMAR